MSKPKYLKVQVGLAIGSRKSQIVDPIEIEGDVLQFEGELNTLVLNFTDAVCALPVISTKYTREDVIDSVCDVFELQRRTDGPQ